MNKRFLLVAALCAAINMGAFAQANLAKGILPTKMEPIVEGNNIPETLVGLTDGLMENIFLLPEPSQEGANIQSFSIDLGESNELGMVKIYWEGAAASDFVISASEDGDTWEAIVTQEGLGLRTEDSFTLPEGTKGRYIKFEASKAVNYAWGVKMREFEVYKAEAAKLASITSSTAFVLKGQETDLGIKASSQLNTEYTGELTYTTNNGTIENGKLTADEAGTCTITAKDEKGNEATTIVYVLDDSMAPTAPIAKAEEAYGVFTNAYEATDKTNWMTWTGTKLDLDEFELGGQKVKVFDGGSKICVSKRTEGDNNEENRWWDFDNTESQYTNASIQVFATKDFNGVFSVESNTGVVGTTSFSAKAGEWTTIEVGNVEKADQIKVLGFETSNGSFAPMLISNIYLYKVAQGALVVSKTKNAKGFYTVTGNITDENVAELKKANGTAYDLTDANIADDVKKIEFANPNAIILAKTSSKDNTWEFDQDAKKLSETQNVITTDATWFAAAKQLVFDDAYELPTNISINANKGGYIYTRSIEAGAWTTAYLPVGVSLPENLKAYEIDTENSTGNDITFKEATELVANKPYILHNLKAEAVTLEMVAAGGDYNLTVAPGATEAGNVKLQGNFIAKAGTNAEYELQETSATATTLKLQAINADATIKSLRAYITLAGGTSADDVTITVKDNVVDGIRNINNAAADKVGNIYSVDGMLIKKKATSTEGLAKGVYVVNGKKVVVK